MAKPRQRAMRRSYLKRFSSNRINAPQGVDKLAMRDLEYHNRVDKGYCPDDKFMETVFGKDYVHNQVNQPREGSLKNKAILEFKARLEEIASVAMMNHKIELKHTRYEHTFMFYGMKGGNCVLVQILHQAIMKRSVVYDSREKAIDRYKEGRIIWAEYKNISPAASST